ncbi:MAG: hypothetical protein E7513_00285 [Ruminococcaceae bacterium]|nr:hypothetical protein [Oscillospiraceae bacterium]
MKVFNCIMGVFSLFAAFYCFAFPGASSLMTTGWIVTMLLGVIGFCGIFEYARNKESKKLIVNSTLGLIFAICAAVLSVIAMFDVNLRATFDLIIVVLFALWLVISGVDSTVSSFKLKKQGHKSWWLTLILGILVILMGMYAGTHLIYATMTLGYVMGFGLTFYGIRLICSVFDKD